MVDATMNEPGVMAIIANADHTRLFDICRSQCLRVLASEARKYRLETWSMDFLE